MFIQIETNIPGVYQFEWQPTLKNASYRAWADLIPSNTKNQEYVVADFPSPKTIKSMEDRMVRQPLFESTVDGYKFKLSFDKTPLHVVNPSWAKLTLSMLMESLYIP